MSQTANSQPSQTSQVESEQALSAQLWKLPVNIPNRFVPDLVRVSPNASDGQRLARCDSGFTLHHLCKCFAPVHNLSKQMPSSISSLLQSCLPLHQHLSCVTVSLKSELKSNWIRLHCFCLLLWWRLILRVVRGQTSSKLSTWERSETLLSLLLFNYFTSITHCVFTRFCQRAARSETVSIKPDRRQPFLVAFKLVEPGTEDKVLSLQLKVVCKKLCFCLMNGLQLQQYY